MEIRQRYQTDPYFHALVDALYAHLVKAELTPTEVREAALLAQILYEERHPRPIRIGNVECRLRGPDA